MTEKTSESQHRIESGPEIVAEFVRRISADEALDRDTTAAIESLHLAGRLTATNLLRALENARTRSKYGPLTKT